MGSETIVWLWLFPIAVTLHNLEEAATFEGAVGIQPFVFRLALVGLTIWSWGVTFATRQSGRQSGWAYLLFGSICAMLWNVFVPHIPGALWLGHYVPGLVTAVVVNLPLMSFLCWRALREQYVSGRKAAVSAVAVPILIAATMGLFFALSYLVHPQRPA